MNGWSPHLQAKYRGTGQTYVKKELSLHRGQRYRRDSQLDSACLPSRLTAAPILRTVTLRSLSSAVFSRDAWTNR